MLGLARRALSQNENLGGPHNNPKHVRSAHLWNITLVAETKATKVEQNTRLERPSLPPFTKYIGALN